MDTTTKPTVRVVAEGFPEGVLINAEDFDEATHVLWTAPEPPAPAAKAT